MSSLLCPSCDSSQLTIGVRLANEPNSSVHCRSCGHCWVPSKLRLHAARMAARLIGSTENR